MVRAAGWLAMAGAVALAGCGGNSNDDGSAQVRLLNATNGYPSTTAGYAALDLYLDGTLQTSNSGLAYGGVGSYTGVSSTDSRVTAIMSGGQTTALSSSSRSFVKDVSYTLVAYGWAGALKVAQIEEDITAADSGKSKLTVSNLATDAGSVDVYVMGTADSLDSATPLTSSLAGGSSVSSLNPGVGTFRVVVTAANDKTDVRLDATGLTLASTQVGTLMLTSGSGGTLVNALMAIQKGTVTALNNTKARARVVGSVSGNGRVTLQTMGSTLAAAATSPSIGSYTLIDGSTSAPVTVSVNGTAVAVANQALVAGGDYTLMVWGDAAAPQFTLVADDNRLPSVTSNAKLRLVHGVAGLTAPLTLAADFSAVASSVAQGQASAWANVTASSAMRLEVTSPLSSTPLWTLTDATVSAKGLYTVFMLGDSTAPQAVLRKDR
jgi:hypothetical protein